MDSIRTIWPSPSLATNESPDEVTRTLKSYQQLLKGEVSGTELWRELKLLNQLGVTRGQMDATPQVIHRKG